MFNNIGWPEFAIVGFILLLLFGSKKIVELARGLGESTKELKKAKNEFGKAKNDDK